MILPAEAHGLAQVLALHFTCPTYQRLPALLVGAPLTTGQRTVADVLRTLRRLAPGHRTGYQRVLPRARWSGLALGCALVRLVLDGVVPDGPVALVGDDAVGGHKGRHVHGKGRHRDPARPTHPCAAWRHGHRWVVLAVPVKSPSATRPWALPAPIDLCRSAGGDRRRSRPHRPTAQLMCRPLRLPMTRFPGRSFVSAGGSGYGTHAAARLCRRHRDRLTLVSRPHPGADLLDPPPPYGGTGRPRVKGDRRPEPRQAVAAAETLARSEAGWYGGGTRRVDAPEGTGRWPRAGAGPVPFRWVSVRDATGTHRDEYFLTTDARLPTARATGHHCGRRDIEATFQEARSALGSGSTRGRCGRTVPRAGPRLPGLHPVVAVRSAAPPGSERGGAGSWPGEATVTLSGARRPARRWLWAEAVLPRAGNTTALQKLPDPIRELLLTTRAPAA